MSHFRGADEIALKGRGDKAQGGALGQYGEFNVSPERARGPTQHRRLALVATPPRPFRAVAGLPSPFPRASPWALSPRPFGAVRRQIGISARYAVSPESVEPRSRGCNCDLVG